MPSSLESTPEGEFPFSDSDLITVPVAPGSTEREPAQIIAILRKEEGVRDEDLALIVTERKSDIGSIGFFIPLGECRPR